jgi:hypothetical protein
MYKINQMLFYNIQYNHHLFHMEYFEHYYSFFNICFNILFKNIKFIIDMFDSLYTYYNLYNVIIYIKQIYISYLPLIWTMSITYNYFTFLYIAQNIEILKDIH